MKLITNNNEQFPISINFGNGIILDFTKDAINELTKKLNDYNNQYLINEKIKYFDNEVQDNFKADFGFMHPHETKTKCKNPVFANHHMHRIAIMKDFHIGSKGDIDETGMPGWVSKFICTGCGKRYKINKQKGFFHPDKLNEDK